ncbi:hypothetical protein [Streptomyces sp. NPDC099088]|uniref:hypothetical protein n=1 Tax=Streptomyces sp. NPDC099088 TaxID=3366101 RepID=UPI0037FAF1CD
MHSKKGADDNRKGEDMQGDGAGEEVAAARARNLQPDAGPPAAQRLLGAPVTSQDLQRAMNGRQGKEARRLQANIDRAWPTAAW